jgi:exodeoxyribonuclease VII large subunit
MPRFPMRIGLVTSPGGAALHDVQFVLRKRWPLATLVFAPAMVQGELAPGQVVAALRRLAAEPDLDVILVVRGGGASEDLHAFNDERVARAIYASPYPVVTGVGHETDVTIADLVADVRAATPSAAAERATPDIVAVRRNLEVLDRAMASAVRQTAAGLAADVEAAAARLRRSAPRVAELQGAVRELAQGMEGCIERQLQRERGRFETMAARLAALDPMATLRRGFAIVQREGGRQPVVSSVRGVRAGDRLRVAVSDGAFWTEVR